MIELDFISVAVGYVVGVLLTWSLTFTLFGCEKCDAKQKADSEYPYSSIYGWNYPYDNDTVD